MSEDRERFEPTYAEIVYQLALYGSYLRRQGFPMRAAGKGIQDRIRALLEEHSNDDATTERQRPPLHGGIPASAGLHVDALLGEQGSPPAR